MVTPPISPDLSCIDLWQSRMREQVLHLGRTHGDATALVVRVFALGRPAHGVCSISLVV